MHVSLHWKDRIVQFEIRNSPLIMCIHVRKTTQFIFELQSKIRYAKPVKLII